MRLTVRRLLLAALAPVLLFPVAASAVCAANLCVPVPDAQSTIESLLAGAPGGGTGGGDGSGVLCEYTKTSDGPPDGWQGDPNSGAPYLFVETQKWGNENPDDWEVRICPLLLCPTVPDPLAVTQPISITELTTCEPGHPIVEGP